MVFSSITFLYLFLPVTLAVYLLVPGRAKNIWLLAVSLIFYAFGEWKYLGLLAASILVNYGSGLLIERSRAQDGKTVPARLILVLSLILNLGALAVFKYLDLLTAVGLALPIGISFFTFQGISYVVDVYRGKIRAQRNPVDFAMYIALFPQLIAGPIVRYSEIEGQLRPGARKADGTELGEGMERFILGLGKKVLIANTCAAIVSLCGELTEGNMLSVSAAWLGAVAYMLQIYFDFSGYSDMAIGIGRCLGFTFPENFDHPYEAGSITEFWRRWHMTLSSFFREYVYIPLGGNRRGTARQILNLLIVWALTGLWHGAAVNFILWGLYYFAFLVLEKFVLKRLLEKLPPILTHIYALFVVLIGWVIFAAEDLPGFLTQLGAMFGHAAAGNETALFYWKEYGILLVVFGLLSTHWPKKLYERFPWGVRLALGILILVLSTASLIGGSYNPFLYFRF